MTDFPAFDFAPHGGTLATKDFTALANGGHTSVAALLDAPELLPMLKTWATYSDNARYGLRSLAERAPAFYRSTEARAHFAKRVAEEKHNRAWIIGLSLLASDDERELVEPKMIDERRYLSNFESVYLAVIVAQRFPAEFASRASAWLEQSKEEIRKWRRDSRHGNGPNEDWLHGLYAALALAPSLEPSLVTQLERRTKEPGAMIALIRRGHAKTIERMRKPEAFIEMHNSGDYTYGAAALLVALGDDGRTMLRDLLRDPTSPVDRTNLIGTAVDLGLWDRELMDAYFVAAETKVRGAVYAARELPLLDREDVRRLEKVPGIFDEALGRQRETSKKPPKPYNDELWQKSTDELVSRLASLKPDKMTRLSDLVSGARRAGDRFAAAAVELASSKNPVTQLVIRIAARPEQRYPASITGADYRAGVALQTLERRWCPDRTGRSPAPAAKPKARTARRKGPAETADASV